MWPLDRFIQTMLLKWTVDELDQAVRNDCARCKCLLSCLQTEYPSWPQSTTEKTAKRVDVTALVCFSSPYARCEVFFGEGEDKDIVCMYAKEPGWLLFLRTRSVILINTATLEHRLFFAAMLLSAF